MPKIIFFVTEDWYFYSHRLPIARAAIKAGFKVSLLTNVKTYGDLFRSQGIKVIDIPLQRRSVNPVREIKTIFKVINVYRSERPDIVHQVAMKPVLYGSIAAFIAGIPRVINALAGMGYLFIAKGFKAGIMRRVVSCLLKLIFRRKRVYLILQNPEDSQILVSSGIARRNQICLIKGSGVDVTMFAPAPEPPEPVVVILPARLLYDKGVAEFVDAARILIRKNYKARCVLVGDPDPENPAVVLPEQIRQWQEEKVVEFWGFQADMPAVLAKAHIVCLPSYREGLPKALLEAAACGKPIVATDVPGCREIVREGLNGFLVPARNSAALAEALIKLIDNKGLRLQMGSCGRKIVLDEFSEQKVVLETLTLYQRILAE
jgi:glycosyltransferase involved in cell wall biosynthesis